MAEAAALVVAESAVVASVAAVPDSDPLNPILHTNGPPVHTDQSTLH